jgi:hypothetical protein
MTNSMFMPEINDIEVLNSSKNLVKIASGYFSESGFSATAYISPVFIGDFIDGINKIGYLKINETLWAIEKSLLVDVPYANFPPSLYKLTLKKV